jgi:hypothetical protein
LVDGHEALAQSDSWAASNGYVSLPHASSLASAPVWRDRRSATASDKSSPQAMLAIVGLPVDTDHEMLSAAKPERLCLAAQTSEAASLCRDSFGPDGDSNFSFNFDLCAFDGDCWHSTAAAVLATGGEVDPRHFSLEAIAKLPFWNLTDDAISRRLTFYKDSRNIDHARFNICRDEDDSWFNTDRSKSAPKCDSKAFSGYARAYTVFPEFPGILRSAKEIPINYFVPKLDGDLGEDAPLGQIIASNAPKNARMSADNARTDILLAQAELTALQKLMAKDNKSLSRAAARKKAEARIAALETQISELRDIVQFQEALDYAKLPEWAFPLVEIYSSEQANCCSPAGLRA